MAYRKFRKGTYDSYFKKKMAAKRRGRSSRQGGKRTFRAKVTSVLMKKAETKYYDIASENVQLYHNLGTTSTGNPGSLSVLFNPWADIPIGTGRAGRIGDRIIPRGMSIKFWIANKADRPNVLYRIMVVRCPKIISGSATGYNTAYPFQTATLGSTGNNMILPLDKDRGFRAYYDKIHRQEIGNSGNVTGNKECHMVKKLWIRNKSNRNIIFDQDQVGSISTITNNPLLVYILPYDSYGTLTTDNVASCAYFARLYYKDV